jgi:hypothetical protein
LIRRRPLGDSGQVFPIYIVVVGGLLFLAFAYLAVGQAAANRNGAQTAADAAALAAAQDARKQLADKWASAVLDPTLWQTILDGDLAGLAPSCWRAYQLAEQNDAHAESCGTSGFRGFKVVVKNNKSAGESIVPATAHTYASASAVAVVEPLCSFRLPPVDAGDDVLPRLVCRDRDWDLDPDHLTDLPSAEDLFDVHLAD